MLPLPRGVGEAGLAGSQQQGALLPKSSKRSQIHNAKLKPWGQPLVTSDVLDAVSTLEPRLALPGGQPPLCQDLGQPMWVGAGWPFAGARGFIPFPTPFSLQRAIMSNHPLPHLGASLDQRFVPQMTTPRINGAVRPAPALQSHYKH